MWLTLGRLGIVPRSPSPDAVGMGSPVRQGSGFSSRPELQTCGVPGRSSLPMAFSCPGFAPTPSLPAAAPRSSYAVPRREVVPGADRNERIWAPTRVSWSLEGAGVHRVLRGTFRSPQSRAPGDCGCQVVPEARTWGAAGSLSGAGHTSIPCRAAGRRRPVPRVAGTSLAVRGPSCGCGPSGSSPWGYQPAPRQETRNLPACLRP